MLGWHISAYRFADQVLRRARCDLNSTVELLAAHAGSQENVGASNENLGPASWQTSIDGVDWLEALVAAGEALATSRSGYPNVYVLRFRHLQTQLLSSESSKPRTHVSGSSFGLGTSHDYQSNLLLWESRAAQARPLPKGKESG